MGAGEQKAAGEAALKAAFLYKFANYVEWSDARGPAEGEALVLGVAGDDDVAEQLQMLLPIQSPESRPLTLRRLRPGDSSEGLHVLFVGGRGGERLLARAAAQGVLTVSDARGRPEPAMIAFQRQNDRLRFSIRRDLAQASGLKLSSRLLSVAYEVTPASR